MALFVLVGLAVGMLGGGGSVLAVPILVFVLGFEPHDAVPTSLIVVALTSTAALVPYGRRGLVRWRTGLVFGGAGMLGSFVAGLVARYIPGDVLLVLLGLLMGAIAIAMLRRGNAKSERGRGPAGAKVEDATVLALLLRGVVVGAVTGLVGAGGGFVVVPAFVVLCAMPMDEAVGTSLFVITLQAFAGFAGHMSHASIPWPLVAQVAGLAIAGSVLGAMFARHVPKQALRTAFGVLVLAVGAALLVQRVASIRASSQDDPSLAPRAVDRSRRA